MKVLFVSTGDSKYGAPKSMMALMKSLKRLYGVECVLLTKKHNELNEECTRHGIENYSMFYSDIMAGSSYEKWYLNFAKHIVKYGLYLFGNLTKSNVKRVGINFSEIDVIHSNTNRVDIGAYVSSQYDIPHVWHLREMDEATKGMVYYKSGWQQYMNAHVTNYIAITNVVKESWCDKGLDSEKIKVIYNGVDASKIKISKRIIDEKVKIVSVGRIEKSKGQEELISAICALEVSEQKRIIVDFIGESYKDYKEKICNLLKEKNCKAEINFKGYSSTVLDELQNYDIGITCSPAEAFGRTTVEYMMAKLLVIATDTGANPELIQNNVSGLLYKQGNADELKQILRNILTNQYDVSNIKENGYLRATSKFAVDKNANEIYNLYCDILNVEIKKRT